MTAGLHDRRRGQSPTITLGPYAGDPLSVDHIIPFSVAPSLDKVIANLELMPLKMNLRKNDRMTSANTLLRLGSAKHRCFRRPLIEATKNVRQGRCLASPLASAACDG
jgi:hypothetical protein